MEELGNLAHGFNVALTLPNVGFMFVGIILGVLIGVIVWPDLVLFLPKLISPEYLK